MYKVVQEAGTALYVPPSYVVVDRALAGQTVHGFRAHFIEDADCPTRFQVLKSHLEKYTDAEKNKVLSLFATVEATIKRYKASGKLGSGPAAEPKAAPAPKAAGAGAGGSGGDGASGSSKKIKSSFAAALNAALPAVGTPPTPGGSAAAKTPTAQLPPATSGAAGEQK